MLIQDQFKGRIPKLANERLPIGYAQIATNCRFDRGRLESFYEPVKVQGTSGSVPYLSIYKWRSDPSFQYILPITSVTNASPCDITINLTNLQIPEERLIAGVRVHISGTGTAIDGNEFTISNSSIVSSVATLTLSGSTPGATSTEGYAVVLDKNIPVSASNQFMDENPVRAKFQKGIGHGLSTGTIVEPVGTGESGIDNIEFDITVIDDHNFELDGTTASTLAADANGDMLVKRAYGVFMQSSNVASFVEANFATLDKSFVYIFGSTDFGSDSTYSSYGFVQTPVYGVWPDAAVLAGGWNVIRPYSAVKRLGVPAPASALTVAAGAGGSGDAIIDRAYVFTNVFIHNGVEMESAPSAADTVTGLMDGQAVSVTIPSQTLPSALYYTTGAKVRIYRTAIGNESVSYRFVKEVSLGTGSTTDDVDDVDLGGVIPSYSTSPVALTWDMPPSNLRNVLALPNGIMAGSVDNTLYFSVPYYPHAWPGAYTLTTDAKIIALAAIDLDIVVLTETGAYIATGSDPAFMSLRKLPMSYGCASGRSVAVVDGYGVIYASNSGIILLTRSGADVVSDAFVRKEQWKDYYPHSIVGCYQNNRYFAFWSGRGEHRLGEDLSEYGAFFIDLQTKEWVDLSPPFSNPVLAAFVHKGEDVLYYCEADSPIYAFNAGVADTLSYTWRSGIIDIADLENITVGQVVHDPTVTTSNVTFKLYTYASGTSTLRHTETLSGNADPNAPFRINYNGKARFIEFEVSGKSPINQVLLAPSMEELGLVGIRIGAAA